MADRRVLKSAALISACTTVSRALGLVRNILMASLFGTSLVASAFVVAFRIPNLFRRLFGEGALSAAFVPVFTEVLEKEGRAAAWRLGTAVLTLMAVILSVIVILVVGGVSVVTETVSLGQKADAVLPLLGIMFPYMLCICLVALCMAMLNSFRHFFLPAATPILLNVVWIFVLIVICPQLGESPEERIVGVAWGIVVAGVIQLAVQVPLLRRYGMPWHLTWNWREAKVRRVLTLLVPAALGMGVIQFNVLLDSLLALWAGGWAPAALSYAELLIYLPLGVVATALGTVLLPTFSKQATREEPEALLSTLGLSLRAIAFVMIPATVGLMVLAEPIVQLLFERGEFDALSTTRTARAVLFYAPGLIVFSLYKMLVPVLYALQDTKTPVRLAVRVVFLNLGLNILFVTTWPVEFKHAGLALATVIASTVNCLLLGRVIQRRLGSPGWTRAASCAGRAAVAAVGMGAAVWAGHRFLAARCATGSLLLDRGLAVVVSMGLGGATYLLLSALLNRSEIRAFVAARRRR